MKSRRFTYFATILRFILHYLQIYLQNIIFSIIIRQYFHDTTIMKSTAAASDRSKLNGIASIDDSLNREIVKLLQNDGRQPYRDIAKALNVSEGTVRNRVQSMKQAGALRIVALIDPTEVRYEADAMIGIKVASGHSVEQVSERLGKSPDVVYILWVSGRYDLLIEIVTNDRRGLHDFLEQEIHTQSDIAASETMAGIKNFKNQFLLKYE